MCCCKAPSIEYKADLYPALYILGEEGEELETMEIYEMLWYLRPLARWRNIFDSRLRSAKHTADSCIISLILDE